MVATYDPQKVVMTWGLLPVSGYADGTMITDTPEGDGVKGQIGTAGESAFVETPNRLHTVAFRLYETSPMNAALAALFDSGNVPAPVTITSIGTGAQARGSAAKLERIPGTTYDNGVPVREWKLIVLRMETGFVPLL